MCGVQFCFVAEIVKAIIKSCEIDIDCSFLQPSFLCQPESNSSLMSTFLYQLIKKESCFLVQSSADKKQTCLCSACVQFKL